MAVIQCSKGHFYDTKKFQSCPHCERGMEEIHQQDGFVRTVSMNKDEAASGRITLDHRFENDLNESVQKTVSLFVKNGNSNPVSGWLICLEGENKGRSFDLHIGKNFIGRSMRSDVVINDPQVSRENHFSIIYDPRSRNFYITTGSSIVYLNSNLLEQPSILKENDSIEIGSSKFMFVPFCKEGRDWDA